MDLWGPSLVTFIEIVRYIIMLMDSTTLFGDVEFLKEKITKITLEVLKRYMMEVEQLTGWRLLSMRVDRGHEWNNWLW